MTLDHLAELTLIDLSRTQREAFAMQWYLNGTTENFGNDWRPEKLAERFDIPCVIRGGSIYWLSRTAIQPGQRPFIVRDGEEIHNG